MNDFRRRWLWSAVPPASLAAALGACAGDEPTGPPTQPTFAISAPSAPSNPSAVAVAFDTIKVSWNDNSTNESGFQVYRSTTGSTGAYSLRATRPANARAFRDAKVAPLTSYCYKIRAFRTLDGETRYSAFTSAVCAKTPAAPRPTAPSEAVAKPASSTSVGVSWTDGSSNETGFRVKRSLDGGSTWTTAATVGANVTAYQDGGRGPEQQVCYRVVAFNTVGTSSSNTDCTTPPAAPTNLAASTAAEGGVNLGWADNSTAEDGYQVERSTDGTTFAAIANVGANSTSYSDAGATGDRNYWYRVQARKDGGFSDPSNVASARGMARSTMQIAYVKLDGEIYVINEDGTGATRLTSNYPVWDDQPAWSPDRQRIAFYSRRDGAPEIYVMNADGSNTTRLTTSGGSLGSWSPAWSPDGTRIAFARAGGDGFYRDQGIYRINADGTNVERLSNVGNVDDFPTWSPDGNKIAFMRRGGEEGIGDMYVMNADGTGLTQLTAGAQDAHPAWSPDGTKLAFTRRTHCDDESCFTDLFVMSADGSHIAQLTEGFRESYTAPTWSLDGQRIAVVFNWNRIHVLRTDGTYLYELSDGFAPSWRE